ncbi:hypothetical protein TCAP_05228 [Tolypocladium capitatum]|uniref:Uncharacterized protein n=1 Tax=Tolypocladium capitatum TaxID=45235 RepID=A0A2K3QBA9_9HYPO|nr:hypothetical protein TCAP_05228 [Tolypocladium capitatum]
MWISRLWLRLARLYEYTQRHRVSGLALACRHQAHHSRAAHGWDRGLLEWPTGNAGLDGVSTETKQPALSRSTAALQSATSLSLPQAAPESSALRVANVAPAMAPGGSLPLGRESPLHKTARTPSTPERIRSPGAGSASRLPTAHPWLPFDIPRPGAGCVGQEQQPRLNWTKPRSPLQPTLALPSIGTRYVRELESRHRQALLRLTQVQSGTLPCPSARLAYYVGAYVGAYPNFTSRCPPQFLFLACRFLHLPVQSKPSAGAYIASLAPDLATRSSLRGVALVRVVALEVPAGPLSHPRSFAARSRRLLQQLPRFPSK